MAIKVYILKKAIMKSSVDEYLALKAEAKEKKKQEKQMNPENPIEQKQKKDLRAVFVSTSDTALQALEIAGVSYEFIRLAGRYENWFLNIFSKPGMWMQRLTTKEPDDEMIEVGIASV